MVMAVAPILRGLFGAFQPQKGGHLSALIDSLPVILVLVGRPRLAKVVYHTLRIGDGRGRGRGIEEASDRLQPAQSAAYVTPGRLKCPSLRIKNRPVQRAGRRRARTVTTYRLYKILISCFAVCSLPGDPT